MKKKHVQQKAAITADDRTSKIEEKGEEIIFSLRLWRGWKKLLLLVVLSDLKKRTERKNNMLE